MIGLNCFINNLYCVFIVFLLCFYCVFNFVTNKGNKNNPFIM